MFEFSLLSPAKEARPASSCQSAILGKICRNSHNLAGMILHNSVNVRVETDNLARAALLQTAKETLIATGCVTDNEVTSKRVNGLHNILRPSFGTAVYLLFWTVVSPILSLVFGNRQMSNSRERRGRAPGSRRCHHCHVYRTCM